MIQVIGPDATAEDLIKMGRLQRLRVATAVRGNFDYGQPNHEHGCDAKDTPENTVRREINPT